MTKKEEAIILIMDKAKALMDEVDVLIENKIYASVISRAYYSCFHATRALLLTKDFTSKTHRGLLALLNQHFVITQKFPVEKASFFSKLMHERIDGEYSDFIVKDFAQIQQQIMEAKEYLAYTISFIQKEI